MRLGYTQLTLGGAVAVPALVLTLWLRAPVPIPVVAATMPAAEIDDDREFETAWRDAIVPTTLMSALFYPVFKSLMADRIPPPGAAAGVLPAVLPAAVPDRPQRHATHNVCERNKVKRKFQRTRHGWRCRR